MDRKKLARLWAKLSAARRSAQNADDLAGLAVMAERTEYAGGNHPMWKSAFSAHRAFPISRHGGNREVGQHVRKVILDHLEADAAAWEEYLDEKEVEKQKKNDKTGKKRGGRRGGERDGNGNP